MEKKSFRLAGTDGYQIPMYAWLPDEKPLCILHIAHGMAEYAERYETIATILVQKGFAVFAHDERAHGKAAATISDLGIAEDNWFYKQVDDIRIIILHHKTNWPQQKIFLLGHSMGSFISQRFFQLYGNTIDGLILSATNGKRDRLMSMGISLAWIQMKLFGHSYRSKLIDKLSFGKFNSAFKPNRTAFDWLSRDTEEVDAYINNPQCGFVCSATFFYYFFKGIEDAFNKENFNSIPAHIPVYALAGDKDPVGLAGKGFLQLISNWKTAGATDISYKLYPGGRHEMMNEINRQEVLGDMIQWLQLHI